MPLTLRFRAEVATGLADAWVSRWMTDRCVIPSRPRPQSNDLGSSYTKVARQ